MVLVKYKGQNYLMFGRTKIVNGFNDIPDQEFYKLMKQISFSSRITNGQLSVPSGFPLEVPKRGDKKPVKSESEENQDVEKDLDDQEEETNSGRLSVKQTLKNIQKSDDADYLKSLIETDDRQKVKEAAQKKLDSLESEEK